MGFPATAILVGTEEHKSELWAQAQANPSSAYPSTERIRDAQAGKGSTDYRIPEAWWEFNRAINAYMGTLEGWEALLRNNAGWINWAANHEWAQGEILPDPPIPFPIVAGIATWGNGFIIEETDKGRGRIRMLDWQQDPPSIEECNPTNHPELFDEFHGITSDGKSVLAPNGKRVYFARCAAGGIGWLDLNMLQLGAPLPVYTRSSEQKILDISRWQGTIDPDKMWLAGIRAVKMRVAVGNYYTDLNLRVYYDLFRNHSKPWKLGGYGVVRPDNSIASQVARVKASVEGMQFEIPFTVDDEVKYDDLGHQFTSQLVDRTTKGYVHGVEDLFGVRPEFYTNFDYMSSVHGSDIDYLVDYLAHLAWYGLDGCHIQLDRIPDSRIPNPWRSAWKAGQIDKPYGLWQFCDKGKGPDWGTSSQSLDLNKPWPNFDYNNFYGNGETAPTEPAPVEPPTQEDAVNIQVKVQASPRLNVREAPGTASKLVDAYPTGTTVTVTDVQREGSYIWGKTDRGWIALNRSLTNFCS